MLRFLRNRVGLTVIGETSSRRTMIAASSSACGGALPSVPIFKSKVASAHFHTASTSLHQSVPRRLSPMTMASIPPAAIQTVASKEESREFKAMFPDLVRDLTDTGELEDLPDVAKWYAKNLQYNCTGGKRNRPMALIQSYRLLKKLKNEEVTSEDLRLARILGWCIEIMQAFFLVIDDVMDKSETRRGRPCWYLVNNIGTLALNDALLLEAGVFQLLKKHFREKPYYMEISELFHDVIFKTCLGQSLDTHTSQNGKPDLSTFTMDRYRAIVKYKTSYYSFYMPVAIAIIKTGITDPEFLRQTKTILLEMGNFFQIQDDYLDCYGDPSVTGKVGTDIQDGKCSWLAVVALQRANAEQKKLMEECYGSSDPEKVKQVKALYEELNVPLTYSTYEEESYKLICTHIQQVSRGVPEELFFKILEKIYKRQS